MLFFVAMTALVLAVSLAAMWPWSEDEADAGGSGSPETTPGEPRRRIPATLEGALVAQLVAGEITPPQYRHAMANLAARDADRHPLTVPPDTGTASA